MWTTRLDWNGKNWVVYLSQGERLVAEMSLDDWEDLSATEYLVTEALRQTAPTPSPDHPPTAAAARRE